MENVVNPGYFQTIWAPIASVGWYIVGLIVIAFYVFPHIQKRYKNWKLMRDQQDSTARYKKMDKLSQVSSDIELARQRLQDDYDKSCALAQLKEEEEKEKKRQKILKSMENKDTGRRLGSVADDETPSTSTKWKSLRSEYNPLMGDNTRGYRPPKRSCCGKGGCG